MAQSPRRTGAETSKTREVLLDCVEQLMLEEGYAAVTFRAVAAKADVTPSLVQYYFRTLDGIFLAAIRRYSDRNVDRLTKALQVPADQVLRVLWEYSWEEGTGALMTEFLALGNHRKTVRAEIAETTERVRDIQLEALTTAFDDIESPDNSLTPGALLLLMVGIPKFLTLERRVGVRTAHGELLDAFGRYLDSMGASGSSQRARRA